MTFTDCHFCQQSHAPLLMCPPAKRVLDALVERGMDLNMPTVEFPEPLQGAFDAFGGAVPVRQVVAKAAVAEVAGAFWPVLILTGQDALGQPLPEWAFPAEPGDMRRVVALVSEMAGMAIRRAATENARLRREGGG